MNVLLLSLGAGAVPQFLRDSTGSDPAQLTLAYIDDAAAGMPFAEAERAGIAGLGPELVTVHARDMAADTLDRVLDGVDAVYVASGETFLLLDALRSNGTGEVLERRVRAGLPYIGCSAGSIVAGSSVTPAELMDDRGLAPALASDAGLGLVDSVVIPHADGQLPPYPPQLIADIVARFGEEFPLLLLRDDQALRSGPDGTGVVVSPRAPEGDPHE
ncbi:Type 1 glutamine amidotransferase-like domain-containing protein [Leucobacter sp. PH1c]|uniref:Type 1 glutamine amidotransferase-like domain-containing protein n=1 Tax=Leucobacter sp. PH1c TaxID=1397278 RepID=UPI00046A9A5C|nr:Type 1 glutamine amidotransferase-like domain-containing protein [Leucobacter sp. PH1c]